MKPIATLNLTPLVCLLSLLGSGCGDGASGSGATDARTVDAATAAPDAQGSLPEAATVTTLATFAAQTEGLTGDGNGNLYTAARAAGVNVPCNVWRIKVGSPTPVVVGTIPTPSETTQCTTAGLALNAAGELFVAASLSAPTGLSGWVYKLVPNEASPPVATVFASDVPAANGIAFDRAGNLWVSDGTAGRGKIWKFSPSGGSGSAAGAEQFRVQPLRNSVALVGANLFPDGSIPTDGIGRQVRSFGPGTLMDAASSAGDGIVANGIAFDHDGDLWIADTARGAIWRAKLASDGTLTSPVGCDTTYSANTLCLSNVFFAHPMLEAVDGIALDEAGNIWGTANGRQAVLVVTKDRTIREIFRNPVNGTTGLRNAGDQTLGNNHVLEFPASPFLIGDQFCTSSFDGTAPGARDGSPVGAGELDPVAGPLKGKISCIDQRLAIRGLALPVR